MTYRCSGQLDEVYATLVVRLHHTDAFDSGELWRNAADLVTTSGKQIGVRLSPLRDGSGEIELHCDPVTPVRDQALFARYVHDHLDAVARNVKRLRTYICPSCGTPVENRESAQRRLRDGKPDIGCAYCDSRIELWDAIERELASPEVEAMVRAERAAAQLVLDSESRERVLVGEVQAIVARANQICRELAVRDHGIDMEIELKDDTGRATGNKLYLQLKSGDSHLRHRKRDDSRVFRIATSRHADYWADQAFPVMLVVRDADGTIEWMEVGAPLRRARAAGDWPPTDIRFDGERLDVMAVRRKRDAALGLD